MFLRKWKDETIFLLQCLISLLAGGYSSFSLPGERGTRMKTILTMALFLILLALPPAWSQQKLQQNILAISDVTIIDATGAPAKPGMTLIITGDRITQIAKTGEVAIPRNVQVIDGKGKFWS